MKAPRPKGEEARLAALQEYQILDTMPEQGYDDITRLASQISGTPIALVSLVDIDRQWFKSKVGLEVTETPRDLAFCAHAILEPDELMVVSDATSDARFAGNPLVRSDPRIRFYAGAPLKVPGGAALGTLCVIDRVPREMSQEQLESLRALSRQVIAQLELRRAIIELEAHQQQLEEANARLQVETVTDELTGVLNRRAFEHELDVEIERAQRYLTPLSLAMFDVDRFKAFNDAFGHPAGDQALKTVAGLLQESSRKSDTVARYGGEEFVIILPNTGDENAFVLAERSREAVEAAQWGNGGMTVSVGLATLSDAISARAALIDAADKALYEAKERGRNRVCQASNSIVGK
jgi:diguanylate cyclase (GGDEF)-like protein